ncbi:glycosyltransferase [Tenggerimyces flavus]|uniref:Glycosyltransferase n=1 Tax=Tenggerimyces flavus TaxID=1708749 RepID=A0ABV7YIU2_9ACTN|nr:glycosyltransferase [Tenggerimyces flavus]MBM7784059.1 glycosyltransferase involved in cell wall biosynthesis [Tenggerimyces flavus]
MDPADGPRPALRVLVCTIVHNPHDTRILHRQIRSMLDAGYAVTYAAPFSACGATPWPELTAVDLPRAVGRNRLGALRAARGVLRRYGRDADVVILHDPELLLALPGLSLPGAVVWDVHEDTGAALVAKPWLPSVLRPIAGAGVRAAERLAERSLRLMLADAGYRERFGQAHPVVPNTTFVPEAVVPSGDSRVVYIGHLAKARGVATIVETARKLAGSGISVDVVGAGDGFARDALSAAAAEGVLNWHGFVPFDQAMRLLDGSLAGLALLRDMPNFRPSTPTKVIEYMAHGVPVISTPLPLAKALVEQHGCGILAPFDDPVATADAILRLRDHAEERAEMGRRGHEAARELYHWPNAARAFLDTLEGWAAEAAAQRR